LLKKLVITHEFPIFIQSQGPQVIVPSFFDCSCMLFSFYHVVHKTSCIPQLFNSSTILLLEWNFNKPDIRDLPLTPEGGRSGAKKRSVLAHFQAKAKFAQRAMPDGYDRCTNHLDKPISCHILCCLVTWCPIRY